MVEGHIPRLQLYITDQSHLGMNSTGCYGYTRGNRYILSKRDMNGYLIDLSLVSNANLSKSPHPIPTYVYTHRSCDSHMQLIIATPTSSLLSPCTCNISLITDNAADGEEGRSFEMNVNTEGYNG